MRDLPIVKKVLLGTFACAAVIVPIVLGAISGHAMAQNDIVPIVRIAPIYPPDALAGHREGDVILSFTISANGTTRDVTIVSSSSPEFEAPAMEALLKWRYVPPTDNGTPVERPGVQTMIRFRLQQ